VTVAIVGAAAVSPLGLGWRGLGERGAPQVATLLATSYPAVTGFEVPVIPEASDAGDAKSRRLMSRAARFAAIAAREAARDAAWAECGGVGYWLGVGASGGPVAEMVAIINASVDGGAVSLARLGAQGLQASNPLTTFQVLNNFTMCHGAILEGTTGPNGAFYSRGAGTVHALAEAVYAIESGDCDRALAGGADTALHPATWGELARGGFEGLVPAEGAGLLALAREAAAPLGFVEHVGVGEAGLAAARGAELCVLAPCGAAARSSLRDLAPDAPETIDVTAWRGEALAAAPALAWLAALARIVTGRARRAAILSLGPDGELGVVVLRGTS
jgi:3-oxoacyl-[acyl-carrier-protein] synthase II